MPKTLETRDSAAPAPPPAARRPVEHWRDAKHTPDWLYGAARAGERWTLGAEVPEAEYDAAVARAAGTPLGYGGR